MQPDWQNASTYEYTETLNLEGWAWEFLRRNPEYKAEWAEYLKKKTKLEKIYGKIASWKTKKLEAEPMAWHYDPPKNPGESDHVWRMRCIAEGGNPDRTLIMKGLAKKWGLRQMHDPNSTAKSKPQFTPYTEVRIWPHVSHVEGPIVIEGEDDDYAGDPIISGGKADSEPDGEAEAPIVYAERSDFAYIEINLRKSITKQLKQAEKQLTELRQYLIQAKALKAPTITKPNDKKFRDYLRVLDAYALEPRPAVKDIAKILCPKKKNELGDYGGYKKVNDMYNQAKQWCEGGYRLLV